MRHPRPLVAMLLAAALLTGCSSGDAGTVKAPKRPQNVSAGPERLLPAPSSKPVSDTPDWTELPAPIASAFSSGVDKARFQAFAAMRQTTVSVRLKKTPADAEVFRALDAALSYLPEDYSVLLNVYAPGSDGKDHYVGYEWTPLSGVLVKKTSGDADQSWDAAITAITSGSATDVTPALVKQVGSGAAQPPLLQ